MAGHRFSFGEFEFDTSSGELRRKDAGPDQQPQRLPPQPASLLALLLEHRGGLVSRDQIRERIWPGVRTDFDRSLHFCIRQVRAALGDSADEARYVENLPRRGYRLKPAIEQLGAGREAPPKSRRTQRAWALGAVLGVAGAMTLFLVGSGGPVMRIGIMPFTPPAGVHGFADARPIAEWILEELTVTAGDRAGIVGPTSTSGYDDSAGSLRALAEAYRLDYVINGRFIQSEEGPRMLAELIRVSDGAHIWIRAYEDLAEGQRIGEEISRHVARELALE